MKVVLTIFAWWQSYKELEIIYKYPYVHKETFLECRVDGTVFSIGYKELEII